MTTSELLEKVAEIIAADAALTTWCTSTFGKAATVWIGIDESDPIARDDYPVVALLGIDQVHGPRAARKNWTLTMAVGVLNEDIVADGSLRTRTGFLQAEELREMVEEIIYSSSALPAARGSGNTASESYHPLYVSFTEIQFQAMRSE